MAYSKPEIEALKNSLLASGQPITAAIHREFAQKIIDELYDAQSRGDLLSSVQVAAALQAGDLALIIRSGQAYLVPASGNYVPYQGATANVNLGEFGIESGFLKLDNSPTGTPEDPGTIYWDADDDVVAVVLAGSLQKIGEVTFYHVKNQTGAQIDKGAAVGFAGTLGASGRIKAKPFLADGSEPSEYFMGVAGEDIPDGADGRVYHFGPLRKVDTSGFSDGNILYASPTVAGGLTATKPTFPNNVITVAAVAFADSNNGELLVRPTVEGLKGGGTNGQPGVFDSNGNLVGINNFTNNLRSSLDISATSDVHTVLAPIGLKSQGVIFEGATNAPGPTGNYRYSKSGNFIFASPDSNSPELYAKTLYPLTPSGTGFSPWRKIWNDGRNLFQILTGDLTIESLAGNGDVILKPHGTGEVVAESNVKAELIYSEEITVTLSTIGNAVTVKTFATTDKAIFTVSAIPTGNKAGYQTANFFKGYDGTNSLFYKSASGSLNFQVSADSTTGSVLEAEATGAAMENEEIKVKILFLNK